LLLRELTLLLRELELLRRVLRRRQELLILLAARKPSPSAAQSGTVATVLREPLQVGIVGQLEVHKLGAC
jgi:hypothetical protein